MTNEQDQAVVYTDLTPNKEIRIGDMEIMVVKKFGAGSFKLMIKFPRGLPVSYRICKDRQTAQKQTA